MNIPRGKMLFAAVALMFMCSPATTRQTGPTQQPPSTSSAPLDADQTVPLNYSVMFIEPSSKGRGVVFFRAPDGTAAVIPTTEVARALNAGYKFVTFGDLLETTSAYEKTIEDQRKRLDDLASDYNRLVERFNRMAAINATTPVTSYQPSQAGDEKRALRLMLFQSLLSRTAPTRPVQVQVTDCTKYPALCVH
jgi:hypothetical protein